MGRTPGSFAVSARGAATYSIPLWTPSGIAGLKPSLGLVYSSNSGDGLYGVGWGVAGLSNIARCKKTIAQDGLDAGVLLTTTDRACLNGNKLRTFSGTTYWADASDYQTELADFSLIIYHNTGGAIPGWFEVHGKNGLIYQYGNTSDSVLLATGTTTGIQWAVNRISDRFGNHIDFVYTNDTTNQVLRPSTITYVTSPGTTAAANYQVLFTYVTRGGIIPTGFVTGAQFQEPYLAQTITIGALSGSSYPAVRTYNLNYTTGGATGRALLKTVQECSPTQCYAASSMNYQNGQAGWGTAVASTANSNLFTAMAVDLNGDGIDDLVYQDQTSGLWRYLMGATSGAYAGPYDPSISSSIVIPMDFNGDGKMDLLVKNSSGNWRVMYFQSPGAAFTYTDTTVPVPTNAVGYPASNGIMAGDVDGDGRDDLIYLVSGGSAFATNDTIYYQLNTGSTFAAAQILYQTNNASPCDSPNCVKFNGNTPFGNGPGRGYSSRVRRADFNGDGRTDFFVNFVTCTVIDSYPSDCNLAQRKKTHWDLMTSSATGVSYADLGVTTSGSGGGAYIAPPLIGDFNGDGCSDIATNAGGNWYLQYGTCYRAGATSILSATVPTLAPSYGGINALALDWDGDGNDDIVEPTAATGGTWGYLRSTGSGLGVWTSIGVSYNNNYALVAEANGDGLSDIVYAGGASGVTPTVLPHNGVGVMPDLATSFTDGFGVNYSPSYTQLPRGSYAPGTGAVYPEQDYEGPLNVVSSYSASNGIGGTYAVTESYSTARTNLKRRAFEGFGHSLAIDNRDSLYRHTYFAQLFPLSSAVSEQVIEQANGSTRILDVVSTLTYATLDASANNTRYFPYASQSVAKKYEFGGALNGTLITQETRTTTYGGPNGFIYGNPSQVVSSTVDKDPTSPWNGNTFTDTVNITPYEVGGTSSTGWCIHLPSNLTEQRTQPSGSLTHTASYAVNVNGKCELDNQIVEPGNSTLQVTTAYAFDACGNVNSVSVTGQTPAGTAMGTRRTQFNYATLCILPQTLTNALGQAIQIGYNYSLGLATSIVDPNNLTTSWTYNDIGQKTLEKRPDATQTAWTLTACTSPSYCGDSKLRAELQRSEQDSTASHTTFWFTQQLFDQFDRLLYDEPQQSNGVQTTTTYVFDALGRLVTKTNPHGNGYASFSTTLTYDVLNRLQSVYRPISSVDSTLQYTYYTYQGRTRSIQDPRSNTTTHQFDVLAELLRVTDPDGVSKTNYAYTPFGAVASIADPASNTTTRTYDALGYHLSGSSDPDRGSWTYQYDSLNELINLRDAKTTAPAWTQTLSYDALGRLTQRVEAEGTSTWTWGTVAANHEIGQLTQLAGLGDTESNTFDAYGRGASHSMLWNGTTYAINYAYNTLGKLDTLTYPSVPGQANRFQVKYAYSNGYLSALQDYTGNVAGTTFWQLTAGSVNMDPWGHVVDETLGTTTPVRIQSAYDAVTSWLGTRQVGTSGSSNNLQDLAYQWDTVGDLAQRQDLKQSLTEVFTNDNLNRLQSSTLNGAANFSAVIDATGNITSRSEAGVTYPYTYDTTHKHAVANVNGTLYQYDANGNMSSRAGSSVTWSSYNLPTTINGSGVSAAFSYGPDRQRKQQTSTYASEGDTGTETTIYVAGLFEVETLSSSQTHYKHFITVPSNTHIIYDLQSVSGPQTTYVTADHLGSGNLFINSAGAVQLKANYSAYGYRRASNWSIPLSGSSSAYTTIAATTRRGYTGAFHEMLDNVGLIHMNARVYDPVIGRFLSADPIVATVGDSQSSNPYGYVTNRPLTMTDPTGLYHDPPPHQYPDAGGNGTENGDGLEEVVVSADKIPISQQSGESGFPSQGTYNVPGPQGGMEQQPLETIYVKGQRPGKDSPFTLLTLWQVDSAALLADMRQLAKLQDPTQSQQANPACTKYPRQATFVNANLPDASQIATQLNTQVGNILGLAGYESNWGGGQLITAGTNNYFSLKAGPAFDTGAIGSYQYGPNTFWAYPGPGMLASGNAFAQSYFGTRVFGTTSPQDFATALNAGGRYNSGPSFNSTLVSTINQANAVMGCP